jgi:hypothetical protein
MYVNYPDILKIEDIKEAYLQPTLQNALRTNFYQSLWSKFDVTKITSETLHLLPIVTKDDIRKAGRLAQNRYGLICTEFFTMGTTGTPLVTVRGDREKAFIQQFFRDTSDQASFKAIRALSINNPYHGDNISIPANIHLHKIGVYDKGSFEHARSILTNRHEDWRVEPYCTSIIGLERCLRAITHDTRALFPNRLRTYLEEVVSYGEYITQRWRKIYEETWNCNIVDRYSLSEFFGGATQSPACGWYHFDPFVIPEVISSGTKETINEGVGLLLLTALYPFQESQPLIRYLTGDLVAITHTKSSKAACLAIRPLGRAKYGVPLPGTNDWLLTPAKILECVDAIPEIERTPLFLDSEQVADPFEIGYPKYKLSYSHSHQIIDITLQISIKAGVRKSKCEEIGAYLISELSVDNNLLSEKLTSGEVTMKTAISSEIEPDMIFYSM